MNKSQTAISDATLVMDNFMRKLSNNKFTFDKEISIGKEMNLDKRFITKQLEDYKKILNSPLFKKVQTENLVKTRILKKDNN